jgi:hypothetical protein
MESQEYKLGGVLDLAALAMLAHRLASESILRGLFTALMGNIAIDGAVHVPYTRSA